jgi:CRISPR/Cas system CSM-associated protein Csm3 (group 7 of RAMP superfamily)
MKDGFNQYIIPGSTLKGLWRSQAKKILTTINKDVSIVEDIFGTDSGSNKRESVLRRGNVFVQDTFILDYKEVHCHRIKIDRFTGGTMDGAKFDEKPINGTVSMQLMYKKSKDEKINHAAYALLLLTAREIALGNISIGSGNNVGYGRINGNEIVFKDGTNRMRIEFEDSKPIMSPDDQKIVDEWIGDLHN